jgi:hypothetical protein
MSGWSANVMEALRHAREQPFDLLVLALIVLLRKPREAFT